MCDLEVDGYGTSLRDQDRTARKQHRCEECSRKIEPGQRYSIFAGTFERDFFSMKFCSRCTKARRWLGTRGHGWQAGEIRDWVRTCAETDGVEIVAQAKAKRLAAAGGV